MNGNYKIIEAENKSSILVNYFIITQLESFTNIKHAFSTKREGYSNLPFKCLNLGYCEKDSPDNVNKNRRLFFEALNLEKNKLILLNQIHSDNFIEIEDANFDGEIKGDGIYTKLPGIILGIQTADCLPLLFYEPKNGIIGAMHLGWKGLLNRLCQKMFLAIIDKYKVKAKNIIIGIGPAIQQCCYEIKEDVLQLFKREFNYIEKCIVYDENRIKMDLLHLLLMQLWEIKASNNNVSWIKLCTYCNPQYFFSYRREGPTGRLLSIICKLNKS